jgi:M6 family metalloprotease-like protein
MNKKLLPITLLSPLALVSCTISFSTSSQTSQANSSAKPVSSSATISVSPVSELLVSKKDGSSYSYPTKAASSSGTNYSAETTSFTQSALSLASDDPVLKSKGKQNLLVIPVTVKDYSVNATSANREKIFQTFFGDPAETSWESLASYYAKSSFGQMILQGTVSDWFDCGYSTSEIAALKGSSEYFDPTWTILDNAVNWYKQAYHTDCQEFDNDNDGFIDGVWLVYSAPDYGNVSTVPEMFWAYTFSDYENKPSTASPTPWRYCWASFDFMNEGYGSTGYDAHTYIHETGHLLGLDDYYVASSVKGTLNYGPMGNIDMMDANIIDHNAYSKFAFGWITPYVVTGSTEIVLKPSASSGEAVLLPTGGGWNGSAFDEYMLLEYYTPTGLNAKDSASYYPGNHVQGFTESGIRIYHVDSRIVKETASSSGNIYTYSDVLVPYTGSQGSLMAHSNSNGWNVIDTNYRLIQEMDCTKKRNFDVEYRTINGKKYNLSADNSTLFQDGDSFSYATYAHSFPNSYYNSKSTMNDGTAFPYTVSFSKMTSEGITLSIVKA